jgi:hypothetical protein
MGGASSSVPPSRSRYQLPLTQPPDVTLVTVFDTAVPVVIGQPLGYVLPPVVVGTAQKR